MSELPPLTEAEVERLQALDAAATPPPWYAHNPDDESFMNVFCVSNSPSEPDTEDGDTTGIIATTLYQSPRRLGGWHERWAEDAALIAMMRNLLRRLLGERQILRAALLSVEWSGWRHISDHWDDAMEPACPCCDRAPDQGHEGGCVVAKAPGRE